MPAPRLLLCVLAALLLVPAATAADVERFWQWLEAFRGAAGHFEQSLYDDSGELLQSSEGRYAILRPGFFRWEIEAPDRQLVVASGDLLWHYDLDLATATQRRASEAATPLQLLGEPVAALRDRFTVDAIDDSRFLLTPNYPQAGFASLELQWQAGMLLGMSVLDRSGQRLAVIFKPDVDVLPSPADFAFEPPAGVDVFRETDQ